MVPLGTLYNMSSREEWKKGKTKALIRNIESEKLITKVAEDRVKIKLQYKNLTTQLREYLLDAGVSTVKSREEALKNRAAAIKELYNIDKELYDIKSAEENLSHRQEMVKYEISKKELGDANDIELD